MDRLVTAPPMPNRRTVFFISDRTGITAEMLGNSLLTQFEDFEFHRQTIPFVDSPEKVETAIRQVNETGTRERRQPIVFSSIVDEAMSETIRQKARALTLDLFQIFIAPLEAELAAKSSHTAGRSHGIANSHEYFARMDAINFAQTHDDGATTRDLDKAQVILIGVSRCGKTPTTLYLALQFGVRAANFPLTPDDFADRKLPPRSSLPGAAVRAHHRAQRLQHSRRAPPQQLRDARELPPRSARGGTPDGARRHPDAGHVDQVDRGDRDDDPASRAGRAPGLLSLRAGRVARVTIRRSEPRFRRGSPHARPRRGRAAGPRSSRASAHSRRHARPPASRFPTTGAAG
jgi:regulator of PEP synthase PpsR (kinase-PPPase family)